MRGFDSHYPLEQYRRRSQVVRQGSAKAPFGSSNLPVASKFLRMTRIAVVGAGRDRRLRGGRARARGRFRGRGRARRTCRRDAALGSARARATSASLRVRFGVTEDLRTAGARFDFLLLTFKAHQWPGSARHARAVRRNGDDARRRCRTACRFGSCASRRFAASIRAAAIGRALSRRSQIVGSVVHVSGNVVEPGRIRQSGGLRYVFGDPEGGAASACGAGRTLARRRPCAPKRIPTSAQTVWLKLVNNVGLNAVSVLRRI